MELGITLDDVRRSAPAECRYDVCLIITEEENYEDKAVKQRYLEGGNYMTFPVVHTPEAVAKAWQECIPLLLKEGYQLDQTRPILERYAKSKVDAHLCELCIPIALS